MIESEKLQIKEQVVKPEDLARLRWRSTRGLLELDLLLKPFADTQLALLSSAQLAQYESLLEHPDPDIFNWLMGYDQAPLEVREIVDTISLWHRAQS